MNRLIPALLVLLSLATTAFGQDIVVSASQKLSNKTPKFRVLGKNMDGYVVRKYGKGYDYIDVYDSRMNLRHQNKQISLKKYSGQIENIILNKRGATVFYTTYSKGEVTFNAIPLDQRYELMDKKLVIDTLQSTRANNVERGRMIRSQDESKILFFFPIYDGNKLNKARVICLSRTLKVLYKTTIDLGDDSNTKQMAGYTLTNDGNFYLSVNDKTANEDLEGMSVYQVYLVKASTGKTTEKSVVVNKKVYGEPVFQYDNLNDNFIVSGFYTESKKKVKKASNGFFFMRYTPDDLTEVQESVEVFTGEFMVKLTGKEKSREDPSLYTFKVRRLIMRADGGAVLVAESLYKDSEEVKLSGGVMNSAFSDYKIINVYHYNDIIVFSINPDNKIDWSSILRKRQLSENDNGAYSSFTLYNDRSTLKFIYLEEVFSRSPVNYYSLSHTGDFEREILMKQDEYDVMLIPKLGAQVSPNEMIIPSYKKNNLKLVKVNF